MQRFWRRLQRRGRIQVHGDFTYGFADPLLTDGSLAVHAWLPAGLRLTPDWLGPRLSGWTRLDLLPI